MGSGLDWRRAAKHKRADEHGDSLERRAAAAERVWNKRASKPQNPSSVRMIGYRVDSANRNCLSQFLAEHGYPGWQIDDNSRIAIASGILSMAVSGTKSDQIMELAIEVKARKLRGDKAPSRYQSKRKTVIAGDDAAPSQGAIDEFYNSNTWKTTRYDFIKDKPRKCVCCGASASDSRLVVDHIKPIRYNWSLRFDKTNLQILCNDCNQGKGSRDITNWTEKTP